MQDTRAEAITAWARTPMGPNGFSRIRCRVSTSVASLPCSVSVYLLDLEDLRRQTSLSNKSFALSRLLLLWAFIFCGLSLPFHPGFFLYVYSAVTISTLTSLCFLLVILSICLLLSPNCPPKENIQGGHISPQN